MKRITLGEIAQATGGELRGNANYEISCVTTKSSEGIEGALFVAIKGERFDGHDFIGELRGAAALISREAAVENAVIVEDTQKALGDAARFYREKFDIPVVGITGSAGKTSTKDMIASVLSEYKPTLKTMGNMNNNIGLPLTVFGLDPLCEQAVIEMGMNHFGEISYLSQIAKPNVAVITNIGTAHIGNLGGQDGILKAKLEILDGLLPGALLILNADDKLLWGVKGSLPVRTMYYGINNLSCDITAYNIILGCDKSKFKTKIYGEEQQIVINAVGEHHVYNALAAIAVGVWLGIPAELIVSGVAKFETGAMRQNIFEYRGAKIIEDCYNANPNSMASSLKVLQQVGGCGRKIAVLGGMVEMGEFEEEAHVMVGNSVRECEIDYLITVGEMAKTIAKHAGIEAQLFEDNASAAEHLRSVVREGDTVLIKASRFFKFEEISKGLQENA